MINKHELSLSIANQASKISKVIEYNRVVSKNYLLNKLEKFKSLKKFPGKLLIIFKNFPECLIFVKWLDTFRFVLEPLDFVEVSSIYLKCS